MADQEEIATGQKKNQGTGNAPRSGGQARAGKPGQRQKPGQAGPNAGKRRKPAPEIIEVRPMASKAKMRKRHWGIMLSFLVFVGLPIVALAYYLVVHATDLYASNAGFSLRSEDSNSSAALLGGISSFIGGTGDGETDMLYEYIQSQDIVAAIDAKIDLRAHFSAPYETDPIFALKPEGTIEDLTKFWGRIVRVSYDPNNGLVNLQALAFTPEMAKILATEIIVQGQDLVNRLNATSRSDSLKYAEEDLAESVSRLKAAREALVRFRSRTQIVDPESDLQGQMGILNSLQAQLADSLIEYDLIVQDTSPGDPRITQAQRRIDVIQDRIEQERLNFSDERRPDGAAGYPQLLAEYESLVVDREFAEETYRAVLATVDVARANAARQTRYLATYIQPTEPEKSEYPRRGVIFGLAALFIFLAWTILTLMYYALRDRK